MGFLRGVGYFFSILMIIVGIAFFPLGLIVAIAGGIFCWMLKKSAKQERLEKQLKSIVDNQKNQNQLNDPVVSQNFSNDEIKVKEKGEEIKVKEKGSERKKFLKVAIVVILLVVLLKILLVMAG
jgi:Ca2+/Na+ antiporter